MFGAVSKEVQQTLFSDVRFSKYYSSVMCIMYLSLHLFPYKINILQLQTDAHKAERSAFRF